VRAGATPVFVDISERDYALDPGLVAVGDHRPTRAILPVHIYWRAGRPDGALGAGRRASASFLLNDACQAHGAKPPGPRRRQLCAGRGLQLLSHQEPGLPSATAA
jgi:dTDP-4-amino-4,6-dideoxygalactose transaminase